MGDDGIAVADRLAVVDDVGQLPARGRRRIENVLVLERHTVKSQEREYLESIAVVVGNTEQLGIGIEGDHRILRGNPQACLHNSIKAIFAIAQADMI
jgi:hypothetical protein